jgi:hypothetical protein
MVCGRRVNETMAAPLWHAQGEISNGHHEYELCREWNKSEHC